MGGLEQEAAGPGAQGVDDVLVEPERGEDEDALARQPPGGLDAVHDRHTDVHQHDVGRVLRRSLDRLLAGAGLGDDLDVPGGLEHGLEAGPHHRLVVGDHDPQPAHASRPSP